jgi:hypothetical protein
VKDSDLKALEDKATPLPWSRCGHNRGGCQCGVISAPDFPVAKVTIGVWGDSYPAIRLKKGTGSIEGSYEAYTERIDYSEVEEAQGKANAAYIVAACNETPKLLARISALRKAMDEAGYPLVFGNMRVRGTIKSVEILRDARAADDKAQGE